MNVEYWFGFKQFSQGSAGGAVACGPFKTRDDAMRERERCKSAGDAMVSIPFVARSKAEAEEKARKFT